MWSRYLLHYMRLTGDQSNRVRSIFQRARLSIAGAATIAAESLWSLYLTFLTTASTAEELDAFYQEAIKELGSEAIRAEYREWCAFDRALR